MTVWNLLLSSILIPLVAIALLAFKTRRPFATWATTFFMAAGLAGFSFFVAPWGTFGLGVRWAIAALFVAAAVTSLVRTPPDVTADESGMRMFVKVLIGFFFGGVAFGLLRGYSVPAGAVDVGFPLKGSGYLVLHGGSSPPSNIHSQDEKQRYAVDFVKLGPGWMRAHGLMPADPHEYAIYGAEIVSPCDGTVADTADGNPDGAPPATAGGPPPNPLGNFVAVGCSSGVTVWLAHLQQGSVAVKPGTLVTTGATVARAGHSGASPEPHLHVHAERDGKAVPLTFEGEWMVRNRTR